MIRQGLGELEEAVELVEELDRATRGRGTWARTHFLPEGVRVVLAAGRRELAEGLLEEVEERTTRSRLCEVTARALLAEAEGRREEARALYEEAADGWERLRRALEQGQAVFGAGRCLVESGKVGEATERLKAAREIFGKLGASPLVQETDQWLARATARTS
jgi:tetratricopeptide (TPR) repeat protein